MDGCRSPVPTGYFVPGRLGQVLIVLLVILTGLATVTLLLASWPAQILCAQLGPMSRAIGQNGGGGVGRRGGQKS